MNPLSYVFSARFYFFCVCLPILVSCQSYGNVTYTKLSYLMKFHSEDFDVDTSDLHNDYITAVITMPIIATAVLFVGMIIFEFSLLFRCCCKCLRCMSHGESPARESISAVTLWTRDVSRSKTLLSRSFYLLVILCCVLSQGIIWSMQFFKEGSDNAIHATSDLKDVSISLEESGLALDVQGDQILNLTALAIPTCPEADVVEDYATDFEDYIESYLDIVGPLPDNLQDLEDFLSDWTEGDTDSTGYVFGVYLLGVVVTLPLIVSFCIKSKCSMRGSLCGGVLFIHGLLVVFCLYFIALSIMGDFCEAPTDNLISITPDSVVEEATYFGTCNGTNPFDESVTEAYDAIRSLELSVITLTDPGGICEGNAYLLDCLPVISDMYTEIDSIEENIRCEPLQIFWGEIVNDSTCHNIYTGLFVLFWTVVLVFMAYFSLLVVSSLIYQYFGDLWHAEDTLKLLEESNNVSSSVSNGELTSDMTDRKSDTRLAWEIEEGQDI